VEGADGPTLYCGYRRAEGPAAVIKESVTIVEPNNSEDTQSWRLYYPPATAIRGASHARVWVAGFVLGLETYTHMMSFKVPGVCTVGVRTPQPSAGSTRTLYSTSGVNALFFVPHISQ
jgi:hypothetical protein